MSEHQYQTKRETVKKQAQDKETPSSTSANVDNADLLELQRVVGNQGVQRLLAQRKLDTPTAHGAAFIQAKLTVGPVDDPFEREADRVANQVVNMPDTAQRQAEEEEELQMKRADVQRQAEEEEELQMKRADIQRQAEEEEELQMKPADIQRQEEEEELQMKPADVQRQDMGAGFEVGGEIEENIRAMQGQGQPLSDDARGFFEPRFGADFSGVNVHTDSQSDTLNRSLNALAFTSGRDVFFRQGEYNPGSTSGQELLAHELTHVVQQGGAGVKKESDKESETE